MGGVDSSSSTQIPKQFGKYSIVGLLATGGMAEVYLARQAGLEGFEKIVVIKRIRPELTDPRTTSLFLDEARLVATFEHPNIAQVYEIGMVNDSYFFVMEYVQGGDVRQLMEAARRRGRTIELADAIYIITHVCSALHYAHEKTDLAGNPLDIIHRDVSPSNVLLSHDGAVKVCDFGIAKATSRTTETQRGVIKGKFSYMSPEQCRTLPLDRRSDVFAIGILLFELSTLTKLFDADSDFELLRAIVEGPLPKPSARVAGYPPGLERIVLRALARAPEDRYPTAQAMQLELEEFAREHKLAMSSVNIARLMRSLFEKRTTPIANVVRSGTDPADDVDTAVRGSDKLPAFLPLGSGQDADLAATPSPNEHQRKHGTPSGAVVMQAADGGPIPRSRRRGQVVWLAGAILAAVVAGGTTITGAMMRSAAQRETLRSLAIDAERITSTLDSAVRSVRMRADGIASAPVLRTAIETDAATLQDLVAHEHVFSVGPTEVVEVFQVRDGGNHSLLRVPAEGRAIPPVSGQRTALVHDGKQLVIVASAPIMTQKAAVGGTVAIAMPVDLAAALRTLADHAVAATLTGLAADVPLLATRAGAGSALVSMAIPSAFDGVTALAIAVAPIAPPTLDWVRPVRWASLGVAVLLLLVYIAGLRRARS